MVKNMKKKIKNKKIIIAGPCAVESREQIMISLREAKVRGVDFVRMNLWKPRTKPGFDGLGEKGIPLLIEAVKMGVNPATEVIIPEHAKLIIKKVLPRLGKKGKLLLWIGSRNQNHYVQQEIARVASCDKRIFLLIKNQPWKDENHWEGIIEHVLAGGMNKKNIIICHRGFTPNGHNPMNFRNVPDYDMAMRIKDKTKISMIFDPSHTGGSVENVFNIQKEADNYMFNGSIIEVHPNPAVALTDAKQQLTWEQFDKLMSN